MTVPEPLRLKLAHSPSHVHQEPGFQQATRAEVKDFFDNPNASRENALNPYLVMQANLYVTQVSLGIHPHSVIIVHSLLLNSNWFALSLSNTRRSYWLHLEERLIATKLPKTETQLQASS
jgi:hypothetical protein